MKVFTTFFAVVLAFTFTSCFHDRPAISPKTGANHTVKTINKQVSYMIGGEFQEGGKWLRVIGKSGGLKEGTILGVYLNNKKLAKAAVKADGTYYTDFKRDQLDKPGILQVIMKPTEQPGQLKELYGTKGDLLTGEYCFNFKDKGVKYTGLKAGMIIDQELIDAKYGGFTSPMHSVKVLQQQLEYEKQQKEKKQKK